MSRSFDARVTAVFGRDLLIRENAGPERRARVRGRNISAVCGDCVRCEEDAVHGGVNAVAVHPRATALYRSNVRGRAEPVVANITRLFVVFAPKPEPDLFVVDRYVAAATSASIEPVLVLNKSDLPPSGDDLKREIAAYSDAGYPVVTCSAQTGEGVDALLEQAAGHIAALVGQSGVGKSSLVRRLVPEANVATGALVRDEAGRHTTTASRMFDLPRGGHLIDSPGVRDFAPAIDRLDSRTLGFVEVARLAPQCRFLDCRHLREPGCAVRAAAESGALSPRRYESYRRLRRLYEELARARGPRSRAGVDRE